MRQGREKKGCDGEKNESETGKQGKRGALKKTSPGVRHSFERDGDE